MHPGEGVPPPMVGILGGGQLGRMLALAGIPLGFRFRFLEPAAHPPVDGLGEVIQAPYDDPEALERLAEGVEVVTYEFENVSLDAAESLNGRIPFHPAPAALAMARDRLHEKEGFQRLGIPVAPHAPVASLAELEEGLRSLGAPAILKTRRMGYDGKGQVVISSPEGAARAWEGLGGRGALILERFVEFRRELSQLAVRGGDGAIAFYPLVENVHRDGILVESRAPAAAVSRTIQAEAQGYLTRLMEQLGYVGVLAVEFFETEDGLVANEMAPRVHNSGHWSQNGALCCQFENHLRAVTGLPLGSTEVSAPVRMLNLLGEVPSPRALLSIPGVHLHLYGKAPRPGRKLGHVNVTGRSEDEVEERVRQVREVIAAPSE